MALRRHLPRRPRCCVLQHGGAGLRPALPSQSPLRSRRARCRDPLGDPPLPASSAGRWTDRGAEPAARRFSSRPAACFDRPTLAGAGDDIETALDASSGVGDGARGRSPVARPAGVVSLHSVRDAPDPRVRGLGARRLRFARDSDLGWPRRASHRDVDGGRLPDADVPHRRGPGSFPTARHPRVDRINPGERRRDHPRPLVVGRAAPFDHPRVLCRGGGGDAGAAAGRSG